MLRMNEKPLRSRGLRSGFPRSAAIAIWGAISPTVAIGARFIGHNYTVVHITPPTTTVRHVAGDVPDSLGELVNNVHQFIYAAAAGRTAL